MATHIALLRYTQQGMENIKESPARLDVAKKAFQAMGAELKEFYLVMGQYDMVIVAEAPDDETVGKAALNIASKGNVHTNSLRAFTEDEYKRMIAALP